MRLLAVVPARSGSKRLPGKNARMLGGRPLLAWSVECARAVGAFADVLVSTDSEELATLARAAGAAVPWLRPAHLATDTATSVDVCRHALDWFESKNGFVDAIALLQPTSPFRKVQTVHLGLELYEADPGSAVVSVSPTATHPAWCRSIDSQGRLSPFLHADSSEERSQLLPPVWQLNGLLYIVPAALVRAGTLIGDRPRALAIHDEFEAIDIDTELDWMLAELALARGFVSSPAWERGS